MTKKQAELIQYKIDNEGGLSSCLMGYSDFPEVKDKEFRRLVKQFCEIAEELDAYLQTEYEKHGLD